VFKYISQILKSFTPAQRITALIILVIAITAITLGPSLIESNTTTCTELEVRVKSQETQILELNARVEQLNRQVLSGQQECTDNLIAKQQEIMSIINGMIADAQTKAKNCKKPVRPEPIIIEESNDPNEPRVAMMRIERDLEPIADDSKTYEEMLKGLKTLKGKVKKTMSDPPN
jgi:TolA-binding protein